MNFYRHENAIVAFLGGPGSRFEAEKRVSHVRLIFRVLIVKTLLLYPLFLSSAHTSVDSVQPTQM